MCAADVSLYVRLLNLQPSSGASLTLLVIICWGISVSDRKKQTAGGSQPSRDPSLTWQKTSGGGKAVMDSRTTLCWWDWQVIQRVQLEWQMHKSEGLWDANTLQRGFDEAFIALEIYYSSNRLICHQVDHHQISFISKAQIFKFALRGFIICTIYHNLCPKSLHLEKNGSKLRKIHRGGIQTAEHTLKKQCHNMENALPGWHTANKHKEHESESMSSNFMVSTKQPHDLPSAMEGGSDIRVPLRIKQLLVRRHRQVKSSILYEQIPASNICMLALSSNMLACWC